MKVLIDTNVILDVLLKREAFYNEAISVLNLAKKDTVQEYVSASAITDIYYISYRQLRDKERVRELLKNLLVIVSVAGVTEKEILNAINTEWSDFEIWCNTLLRCYRIWMGLLLEILVITRMHRFRSGLRRRHSKRLDDIICAPYQNMQALLTCKKIPV